MSTWLAAPRLRRRAACALLCALLPAAGLTNDAGGVAGADVRVKDLGKLQSWRDNALVGSGLLTGLAGTGDSASNRAARQALANALSRFDLTLAPEHMHSRNVAVVLVTAALPAAAREGDSIDVTVTSVGDARSLVGGTLMLTALKAADGNIYALAQGAVSVGGYRYDGNGNVLQKNHPTVGSIPAGATVEVGLPRSETPPAVTFVLASPDYTTAHRVAQAINQQMGEELAFARDAAGIEIAVPEALRERPVDFFARIENVAVAPDRRAKVIVNERTGTVVAGGDVRLSSVTISHGDIKVSIAQTHAASQPQYSALAGAGVRTAIVSNTQVNAQESDGATFVQAQSTVADLVQALARMKTSTRDIISILRAVKAAGALHAELLIQ